MTHCIPEDYSTGHVISFYEKVNTAVWWRTEDLHRVSSCVHWRSQTHGLGH